MAYDQNVQYLSLAFWQIIMTAGPILAIALGVGLFIGLIQAATSIQEMTLTSYRNYLLCWERWHYFLVILSPL